jgi:hypothetical protein
MPNTDDISACRPRSCSSPAPVDITASLAICGVPQVVLTKPPAESALGNKVAWWRPAVSRRDLLRPADASGGIRAVQAVVPGDLDAERYGFGGEGRGAGSPRSRWLTPSSP